MVEERKIAVKKQSCIRNSITSASAGKRLIDIRRLWPVQVQAIGCNHRRMAFFRLGLSKGPYSGQALITYSSSDVVKIR